jgi:hypothetical protein
MKVIDKNTYTVRYGTHEVDGGTYYTFDTGHSYTIQKATAPVGIGYTKAGNFASVITTIKLKEAVRAYERTKQEAA